MDLAAWRLLATLKWQIYGGREAEHTFEKAECEVNREMASG